MALQCIAALPAAAADSNDISRDISRPLSAAISEGSFCAGGDGDCLVDYGLVDIKEYDMNLFIIGYMACGKTTFGRALAKHTGREFIDLDFYIEQRFRKSINEIFAEKGEEGFRNIEASMLREAGEFEDVIISCGGGTPCFHDNMDYMLSRGDVVWLKASPERITQRLIRNSAKRPLMRGKSPEEIRRAVDAGLEARDMHYNRANIHYSGENLEDRRQISESIAAFLRQYNAESE